MTELDGTVVAVTAFHIVALMGAPGTVPAALAPQVNPVGREIVLKSFDAPVETLRPVAILPVDSVSFGGPMDVGAMMLPAGPHATIPLATDAPEVGDTVWLHAQLRGAPDGGLLHPATVLATDSGWVTYVFHDDLRPAESLIASERASIAADTAVASEMEGILVASLPAFHLVYTSGAPVLDRSGHVVALNILGGAVRELRRARPGCCGSWPETQLYGRGVPAETVRRLVARSLQAVP